MTTVLIDSHACQKHKLDKDIPLAGMFTVPIKTIMFTVNMNWIIDC